MRGGWIESNGKCALPQQDNRFNFKRHHLGGSGATGHCWSSQRVLALHVKPMVNGASMGWAWNLSIRWGVHWTLQDMGWTRLSDF
jgi:hypothetical protein